MPRPPIDLTRKIKDILQHQGPLPPEAEVPLEHFERSVADVWNMLLYFERMVDELQRQQVTLYPTVLKRHFIRLNSMMLVNLIESFERFLKELAAVCVDHVAEFVLDKRFEEFQVKGSVLAAHFRQGTLGKSLAWLVSFHLEPQLKGSGVVFGERATRGEIVWPQTNRPPYRSSCFFHPCPGFAIRAIRRTTKQHSRAISRP